MTVTPNTTIFLLKCPLTLSNEHQITFASKDAQTNYFKSLPKIEVDANTYQRKDGFIRFDGNFDDLIGYNYCMYQNADYNNKWFYAYITDKQYQNGSVTNVYLKSDVYQTWQFDLNFKKSFIEREHVNDDTIGLHTKDENLNLGEFVANKKLTWLHDADGTYNNNDMAVTVAVTDIYNNNAFEVAGGIETDGIYSGVRYFQFKFNSQGLTDLNNFIKQYEENAKADAINSLFMIPLIFAPGAERGDHLYAGSNTAVTQYINADDPSISSNKNLDFTITKIDGYTPKNNKLYTSPFNYILASNNNGSEVIYNYEEFYTLDENGNKTITIPKFRIKGTLTPGGSIRITPRNYKGCAINDIEGFNLGKFPICSWNTDVYTNWLSQNGVNIGLGVASSAIQAVGNLADRNIGGAVNSAFGIARELTEVYKASRVPNQARGNTNSGDVISASGKNDFIFYCMSIKQEYAKQIDDFFTMYGYKIDELKQPNLRGRQNWNYVKTIGANILGNIPQEDLEEIKDIFNNGVTLWHNASNYLNYDAPNGIV